MQRMSSMCDVDGLVHLVWCGVLCVVRTLCERLRLRWWWGRTLSFLGDEAHGSYVLCHTVLYSFGGSAVSVVVTAGRWCGGWSDDHLCWRAVVA